MASTVSAVVAAFAGLSAAVPPLYAQSAANVAVVINDASPASERIGLYYADRREIPDANVIRIRTSTRETIDRRTYAATIEQPIAAALARQGLQDRVLYLVLTKGIPLRIAGTAGKGGTMASVDSELTLMYRRMTGRAAPPNGHIDNPYYLGDHSVRDARPFSHREHDIYLVTRLDAFTVADVLALIDRGMSPVSAGRFVLDQRAGPKSAIGDGWLAEAARRLTDLGHGGRVALDEAPSPTRNVEEVLGYYSWGSNDHANQLREFKIEFVPGGLAALLVSTGGRTFALPPDDWAPSTDWNDRKKWFAGSPESLIADLIREGATGVAANVAEPLFAGTLRPQILFPAYLSGFNLVESFYMALPHLSWQSVIVGDPLCRPMAREPLTPVALEDPVDTSTNLPGLFARRRLEMARTAMRGVPDKIVALTVLAENHLAVDNKPAARAALEEAAVIGPDQPDLFLQLAMLDDLAGDSDAAIRRYRRVLELQPKNAIALNNLAYRLAVDREAYDEALPLARKAATLAPDNPTVLDTVGWIEHLLGNHQEAAMLFTKALSRGPQSADIHLHAAIVYAASGAMAAAENQLTDALKLDPGLAARDDVKALRDRLGAR